MDGEMKPANITIESSLNPDKPYAVIVTRPGDSFPRAVWSCYETYGAALAGSKSARAYMRDTVRGVV